MREDLFAVAGLQLPGAARLWVPGRIEVLGKHTDYGGGRSLLAALDRGFHVVFRPRGDDRLDVLDALSDERVVCAMRSDIPHQSGWGRYITAVARRTARNFPPPIRGADIAFASDLAPASGMSSSSALLIAVFMALARINGWLGRFAAPEGLAGYLGCVENGKAFGDMEGDGGVGTFGGSQDHTAILCSTEGALARYSFCPVRREGTIPLPAGVALVIAACGVRAVKTAGAMEQYNRASGLLAEALGIWNQYARRSDATMMAALESAPDAFDRLGAHLASIGRSELMDRVDQFHAEAVQIVPAAGEALDRGDLGAFGLLVDRSQRLAELKLKNQIPQTMFLARAARDAGALAASAFGAGFGGSVWAIAPGHQAADFEHQWRTAYRRAFPADEMEAQFFQTRPGPPAWAEG